MAEQDNRAAERIQSSVGYTALGTLSRTVSSDIDFSFARVFDFMSKKTIIKKLKQQFNRCFSFSFLN